MRRRCGPRPRARPRWRPRLRSLQRPSLVAAVLHPSKASPCHEWLNVDVEMGKPYDIFVRNPLRGPDGRLTGSYEEFEVDVKVAGIKAHFDPARPDSKKPNATREFKIELRIPEDTLRLWRAPPGANGARRRVLRVIVPAMSARA